MDNPLTNIERSAKPEYPAPFVISIIRYVGWSISKLFWRIRFHGTHNIPKEDGKGLIIAPNHQTYFDPFWVCFPVRRRFRFMAWDKAFDWFMVGRCIRYLGAFPVSIERGAVRASMEKAKKCLADGATLIIFPEGSREFKDGNLLPFKSGTIKIAMETGVPIMPVTIKGANRVWSQGMRLPRPGKVDIYYHPPMNIPPCPEGIDEHIHTSKLTEQIKAIIESRLQ